MASAKRRDDAGVIDRLHADPHAFQLLPATRLIESAGEGPVRFSGAVDQGFPASDLQALRRAPDGGSVIETGVMTFFGPHGPLPQPLADAVARCVRDGDEGPRAFLDIFVDRLVRLMLDILRLERPADWPDPADSPQSDTLLALCGRLKPGHADDVDRALMAVAGLTHQQPQSLHAAELALSCHFAAPVRLHGFVGGWTPLDRRSRPTLSADRGAVLGGGATLGGAAWTQDAGYCVDIGPVGAAMLEDLLPGGRGHDRLAGIVAATLPQEADVTCRVSVRESETPRTVLGSGSRLGWTSWIGAQRASADGVAGFHLDRMAMVA